MKYSLGRMSSPLKQCTVTAIVSWYLQVKFYSQLPLSLDNDDESVSDGLSELEL